MIFVPAAAAYLLTNRLLVMIVLSVVIGALSGVFGHLGAIAALTCHTKCVDRIEQWLAALPRPSRLAVEAVGFVEWFIDRFRPCVDRMDIADATELASRRGKRRKSGGRIRYRAGPRAGYGFANYMGSITGGDAGPLAGAISGHGASRTNCSGTWS